MMTVAELITAIQRLPRSDQDRIVAAVKAFQSIAGASSDEQVDDDATLTLRTIVDLMRNRGLEFTTVQQLTASSAYKTFKDRWPGVQQWLDAQKLERNEKRAVLDLGVRQLHKDLLGIGVPVGTRMLMQQINQLPVVLDQQFPGYARLGLLKLIVRGANGGK